MAVRCAAFAVDFANCYAPDAFLVLKIYQRLFSPLGERRISSSDLLVGWREGYFLIITSSLSMPSSSWRLD